MNEINKISPLISDFQHKYHNAGSTAEEDNRAAKATPSDKLELSFVSKKFSELLGKTDNDTPDGDISDEEKKIVEELKKLDAAVRQHEQAHIAAGGGLVKGAANYSYQAGPDGKRYAVGGEVQIDISPESEPQATIRKMQQVRRAALAPSDPSPQDRAVAAIASRIESQAMRELQAQRQEEFSKNSESSESFDFEVSPQSQLALKAYRKASMFNYD